MKKHNFVRRQRKKSIFCFILCCCCCCCVWSPKWKFGDGEKQEANYGETSEKELRINIETT